MLSGVVAFGLVTERTKWQCGVIRAHGLCGVLMARSTAPDRGEGGHLVDLLWYVCGMRFGQCGPDGSPVQSDGRALGVLLHQPPLVWVDPGEVV